MNFARCDAKLEQRIAQLDAKMEAGFAKLKSELVRWMFAFWATTTIVLVGLFLRR